MNYTMAEPARPLPHMTDEEEGGLTEEEVDSRAATSDYGAGEQRSVSNQSGKEAQCIGNEEEEEDHGSSCEKVEHYSDIETLIKNFFLSDSHDSHDSHYSHEEKTEIVLDVIMAKKSDTCREEGNKLFKEKKVGFTTKCLLSFIIKVSNSCDNHICNLKLFIIE